MKILLTGGAGYVEARFPLAAPARPRSHRLRQPGGGERRGRTRRGRPLIVGDIAETDRLAQVLREHRIEAGDALRRAGLGPRLDRRPRSVLPGQRRRDQERARRDAAPQGYARSSSAAPRRPTAFTPRCPCGRDSPQLPETPYGTTKLAAEWLIKDYARAYGLGYTLLRYFNASGADPDGEHGEDRRHESHLIPLIFQVAVGRREKLLIYGSDYPTRDGTCVRDYIHTEDLAQAHQLAVESPGAGHGQGV